VKPPCPPKQGLLDGECVTYCSIDNFVNRYTNETFEEALSKCIYSCPDGLILNEYYDRCVKPDIYEFFNTSAEYLATQKTTGQLIGSLSQNLTCEGEQFTTPFSN